MIVTAANPLESLSALRTVDMVVAKGLPIHHPKCKRNAIVDSQLDRFM